MILTKNIIYKLNEYANKVGYPYETFGVFGVITYPFYYLIWKYIDSQSYENFPLRLIAVILCLLLILKDKWPEKLSRFLGLYWYLTLLYCLPFLFTFFLLKNNFSTAWILNTMSVLVLSILILDLTALSILLPIGILAGWLCFRLTTNQVQMPDHNLPIIVSYLSIIIFGGLFAHKKERIQNERIQTMTSLAASIAHELRTPLRTISSGINGMNKYLPDLLKSYQLAKEADMAIPYINPIHHKLLTTTYEDLESEIHAAFTVIDMLLINVNPAHLKSKEFKNYSIESCIEEALRRYPFDQGEIEWIQWQKENDFLFNGDNLSVIHLLFNLLKNAIYYVKASGKEHPEIRIWTELNKNTHSLHFKDNGSGILPKQLPYIFDRFYSKTLHGAGVGLSFCKLVMESMGGSITCHSVEKEYTEFVLRFRKIESH